MKKALSFFRYTASITIDYLLMVQSRFCPEPQMSSRGSLNCACSPVVVNGNSPRLLLMLRWTWAGL